ncbi:MAG: transketolase [Bacteroidales bacterium]|nr:transketolase [Candidatus Colimorpha onthohippi]
MKSTQELQTIATQVRRDIVRMTTAAKSGHPGGSLGTTDWMTAMQFNIMQASPETFTMDGNNQDMLFVSQGHITPVIYSTMARRGYFEVSELATFRKFATRLQGHPSVAHNLPGIRMASGSLGQGMSVGIGAALGKKMRNDKTLVYTLHGDGELQEGQIWESVMFAGAKGVDNLISTIDYNGQQIDGTTDQVMSLGDLKAKFESFMWTVVDIANGNDMQQVLDGMAEAKNLTGKGHPVVVLLHTEMGYGVDFMQGTNKYHGAVLSADDLPRALAQLPETEYGDF